MTKQIETSFEAIADFFAASGSARRTVGIFPHERHDADAYGAAMSLSAALEAAGCETFALFDGSDPRSLRSLPFAEKVIGPDRYADVPELDVALVVDCHDATRLGGRAPYCLAAGVHVVIDHHLFQGEQGSLSLIDASASSTCELCFELISEMEKRLARKIFSRPLAELLIAGIVTDTGSYAYSNTTPRCLRQSAALLEQFQVDLPTLHYELFKRTTLGRLRLKGDVYLDAETVCGGRILLARVTRAMLENRGVQDDDLATLASELRSIEGVDVAVLHVESPDGIRLNIRSSGNFNAAAFAMQYGGGGHARAAGATMRGVSLKEAMAMTRRDACRELQKNAGGQP